jgi:hypothetical protein
MVVGIFLGVVQGGLFLCFGCIMLPLFFVDFSEGSRLVILNGLASEKTRGCRTGNKYQLGVITYKQYSTSEAQSKQHRDSTAQI